jgi:hypothetical protein
LVISASAARLLQQGGHRPVALLDDDTFGLVHFGYGILPKKAILR